MLIHLENRVRSNFPALAVFAALFFVLAAPKTSNADSSTREIHVEKRFLNLPVKNGAPKRHVSFQVGGKTVREFDMELAEAQPIGGRSWT